MARLGKTTITFPDDDVLTLTGTILQAPIGTPVRLASAVAYGALSGSIAGEVGMLPALIERATAPLPGVVFSARIRGVGVEGDIHGSTIWRAGTPALEASVTLAAREFQQVVDTFALPLSPATPLNLTARVTGTPGHLSFDRIEGTAGESRLRGEGSVKTGTHGTAWVFELESQALRLEDLGLFGEKESGENGN